MATDPQAVAAVQAALEALAEHHPTRGMAVTSGVTCACVYWTGSERQPPRCTGDDGLDYHRAAAVVERLAPTIAARALEDAAEAPKSLRATRRDQPTLAPRPRRRDSQPTEGAHP